MPTILPLIFVAAFLAAMLPATQARAAAAEPAHLNLAGEWRFALDRASEQRQPADGIRGGPASTLPPGDGLAQQWFNRTLTNRIRLPGILQAQGYGDDISVDTPWVLTLGDAWWKLQPAALREHFSQPGHVEVPFLSQPPKHYLGVAWYQRDLKIPAAWQGRHFKLLLERPHWQTTVWVDGQSFPPNDSLVAPHLTDLGLLAPGRHRLTIRIDNRTQLPAQGHLVDGHSVSDALGATWNGVAGRIELMATTPVWIDDAQVFPNVAKKSALIKVKIGNATGRPGSGNLRVGTNCAAAVWEASGGQAEIEVPLGAAAKTWDEFHPNLQHLTLHLQGPDASDSTPLTFGLREITHDDKNLLLNGRPLNLRLTHSGGDFPLTGSPATEAASWKRIIKVCQAYGLNGIRFHSWCPPEAAFAAADELGFYLQPECGMWNDFSSPAMQQRLYEETARVLQAFGNHPSFILFSPSNEPRAYQRVTPQWAAASYQKDSRRLYSAGTGWSDPSQVNGPQYASLVAFNRAQLRNSSGWFGRDYRQAVENVHIPVLAHEVGQWCAYPDFGVIKKFTGYLRPGNYDIFRYLARQQGVLEQNRDFARASGHFQVECYKEEIEANLRTPGLSGFQLLDLHDYLGQGAALIGIVDAFWQPKSYETAAQFRRFAGPTVPLARLAKRTFTTDQTLESDVKIYHFGQAPLRAAAPYWKILDAKGRSIAAGQWTNRDIPIGKNIPLGKITVDLSGLPAPAACKLVVGLRGAAVENDWNFWLYPAATNAAPTSPGDILVTRAWPEAAARLAAGGKVLFIPAAADLDPMKSPPMKSVPVFWNIQMTVRPPNNPVPKFDAMLGLLCDKSHPALAGFPTDKNCDWQWTPIINNVRSVNLSAAPRTLRPIVAAIDDWNRNWRLGVIFECNVGPGRLLVCAVNLNHDAASAPAGLPQLRRSLLDYMAGPRFKPAATLTPEQVAALWSAQSAAPAASTQTRASDPDLNDGSSLILSSAQMQPPIPLWPGGAPGALGTSSNDIPTLTPYLPDPASATGAAMIICPGGGYQHLAPHEGNDYALWLNQHGVTCFVLQYRLGPRYHHPAMLQDAARALRMVRARADDWKIDPKRIGIMGSSAGGHLASTLMTHFDSGNAQAEDPIERQSSRPDIGILCYPVITLGQYAHKGSKDNLLGGNPSPDLVQLLSSELQVTPNTPPCFLWTTFEDKTVPMENSMLFASALRKNNVPFALDIYQKGGHGLGLADKPPFAYPHPWAADCLVWLKVQKFVN